MTQGLYAAIAGHWAEAPDAVAIVEDSRRWTRAELGELAGRIHGALQGLGAEPGKPVCVIVEKSVQAFATYLACLRGGYAFFPINAGYTDSEIEYLVGDAGPKVLVADPERAPTLGRLAADRGAVFASLAGDGSGSLMQAADKVAAAPEVYPSTEQTWAALLYTSGTTGKPKGAVLSHGNLLANACALIEAWRFTGDDVILHVLPIFHVHGLFVAGNIAMLTGARLIWRRAFDAVDVIRRLKDATAFMAVPTLYTRLLGRPEFGPETVSSIRLFVSGSAPLDPVTFETFRERTGRVILERYGMTETNMLVSNPYDGERVAGSVGYPLPGVQVRLRAEGVEPPAGEVGTVQVKGPNVFQGYLNAPDKTAAAFTEDGFFITGDLGYMTEDGRLYLVGRQSDMIISGGYNVYPTEVEAALIDLDGVAEAAVFGLKHPDFGEAVAAAVAPRPGIELAEAELIKACRQRLAGYKTPKRVFLLDALPRNAMGKTDRKALRAQFADAFA
ncbi:MAG: AMP-binding protein [Caulobacteraceae bacterium]